MVSITGSKVKKAAAIPLSLGCILYGSAVLAEEGDQKRSKSYGFKEERSVYCDHPSHFRPGYFTRMHRYAHPGEDYRAYIYLNPRKGRGDSEIIIVDDGYRQTWHQ